jgi:hypothetical protein
MPRQAQVPGAAAAPDTETAAPAPEAASTEAAAPAGQLRAADVDPTKIKRAVLTADGWVCPVTAPAPPTKE